MNKEADKLVEQFSKIIHEPYTCKDSCYEYDYGEQEKSCFELGCKCDLMKRTNIACAIICLTESIRHFNDIGNTGSSNIMHKRINLTQQINYLKTL